MVTCNPSLGSTFLIRLLVMKGVLCGDGIGDNRNHHIIRLTVPVLLSTKCVQLLCNCERYWIAYEN